MKHNIIKYGGVCEKYISRDISDIEFLQKINSDYDENIDMDMKQRIEYLRIMHKNKNKNNFRFDEKFAILANNYDDSKFKKNIYDYYYTTGLINNMIVHPSQIKFYYDVEFITKNNNIFVLYQNKSYALSDFTKKYMYEREDFSEYIKICGCNYEFDNSFCIVLHIGYSDIGDEIINKIINSRINLYCNLYVNINEDLDRENIILKIKKNFNNYTITTTKNFGNDIAPFILLYDIYKDKLKNKTILKIHTKYDDIWRQEVEDLFFDDNLQKLICIINNNKQINCVGNINHIINYNKDKHNRIIIKKIFRNICNEDNFFAGTMFMCKYEVLDLFMDKIKPTKKSILFLPYYYDNVLFWSRSPVHCAERIFGYIAKDNFKYNLGISEHIFVTKCCIYASHIKDLEQIEIIRCNINLIINNVCKLIFIYSCDINFDVKLLFNSNKIQYIKVNNIGLDIAKYYYGLNILKEKYDWYILINDSVIFLRDIKDLFYVLNYCDYYKFIGLIDSAEIKYHYQSFYWCIKEEVKLCVLDKFKSVNNNTSKQNLIRGYEVEFSNALLNMHKSLALFKFGYFGEIIKDKFIGDNPNFLIKFKEYVEMTNYPIIKYKLATCKGLITSILNVENINVYFNWKIYLQYNKDLPRNWTEIEYAEHFYSKGIYESRIFSVDFLNKQKKYVSNLINLFKIENIKKNIIKDIS